MIPVFFFPVRIGNRVDAFKIQKADFYYEVSENLSLEFPLPGEEGHVEVIKCSDYPSSAEAEQAAIKRVAELYGEQL